MKKTAYLLLLLFPLLLCSCSTVINTTTQDVEIKSTPENAKITIDGRKFGTTPQIVNIERGSNHIVKFELAGYDPYEIEITRKLSSWVWLNVLNGFIPGFAIDFLNGSMHNLLPTSIDIWLTETPKPKVEPKVKK